MFANPVFIAPGRNINNKSGSNPHELEYHKLQLTSSPGVFHQWIQKGRLNKHLSFWIRLIPDRTRRRTAKPLFKRRTLWLKELSSPIMHGKCVSLVLLKTYWQADWLSQKFFKVCLKTNNTWRQMFKMQFMLQQRCEPCQSHFCNNKLSHTVIPLVALCNTQTVAIFNNACRIL